MNISPSTIEGGLCLGKPSLRPFCEFGWEGKVGLWREESGEQN